MNGAELPCGSILQVEPADPQYKKSQPGEAREEDVGHYGPSSCADTKLQSNVPAQEDIGHNSDDDLHDFFDSLT
jgi:hypothetical protein